MQKYNKSMFGQMTRLAITGVLLLSAGATPAPNPPSPAKAPVPHTETRIAPSHLSLPNPHLHGAKAVVAKHVAKENKVPVARHWVGHWSFAGWAALHRGTGTIEGEVHTAGGSPVVAAHMVLRHAHGGIIRNWNDKHITTTSSGGTFIMRHVRIGSYRVRASKGKSAGASSIHVHGGAIVMASVKI